MRHMAAHISRKLSLLLPQSYPIYFPNLMSFKHSTLEPHQLDKNWNLLLQITKRKRELLRYTNDGMSICMSISPSTIDPNVAATYLDMPNSFSSKLERKRYRGKFLRVYCMCGFHIAANCIMWINLENYLKPGQLNLPPRCPVD